MVRIHVGALKFMVELPHEHLFTRLQPSRFGGVGVFAIQDIPKDSFVFTGDATETVTLDAKLLKEWPSNIQKMYTDFCVFKNEEGAMICPKNFNAMSVAWYLNHSDSEPNIGCDKEYTFYALRDIQQGEELLADYKTYSDLPPGFGSFIEK